MEKDMHEEYHVLKSSVGGGPLGLGDPDDRTLRKVESEILIQKRVKENAHLKCKDVVEGFRQCSKDRGLLMPLMCRKQAATMNECLMSWYKDPDFLKQATEDYLTDRAEYRRTGIHQKQKRKESATF